jgi:hypothetical protein
LARDIDWDTIRAEYEAGASQASLAKKHGVSRGAIQKHIAAEGWAQDLEPVIQRKVAEKVAGVVAGSSPQKKAEAIDAEAMRRADVNNRHRDEWDEHKTLMDTAIGTKDFESAKLAKITAETLKIRQEGERKAWGLDIAPSPSVNTQTVNNYSRDELVKKVREAQEEV